MFLLLVLTWSLCIKFVLLFFFHAEDGIRDGHVTGVQTCALPIWRSLEMPKKNDRDTTVTKIDSAQSPKGPGGRSEERRVGKECRARGSAHHLNKDKEIMHEAEDRLYNCTMASLLKSKHCVQRSV